MAQQAAGSLAKLALGVATAGAINTYCLYNVEGGFRAVMFDRFRGVLPEVSPEGTHFMIPGIQRPVIMDVRSQPRVINSVTGTKDLQMVNISLRVLSRPVVEDLPKIYQSLGENYNDRVLPSLGNEILKSVVARYNADELLSKRELISQEIRKIFTERAGGFNLLLDDVSITHLTFGKEFTKAIESKQVAQQDAERAQYVVEKAKQEKKAKVIIAEGEAAAATRISQALAENGSGLIEVRRIDAARDIAATLAQSRNITYLPGGQGGGGSNILLGLQSQG